MDITPPRLPLDSLLKRRPMTVYTVSCPPAEAVALRTVLAFHRHQARVDHDVQAFLGHRLVGHRGHGHARAGREPKAVALRLFPDELSDVPPSWLLGGLVVYLTSKAVRAQLRHLNKTTIIIAARPLPDAEQACTEL